MLLQVTQVANIFTPTSAKADSNEIYATNHGGSDATVDKINIRSVPDGNVATIPSDVLNRYVYGKTYTNSLSRTITKVEIAVKYKVDFVFSDDQLKLSYKIGSTSNPDGSTTYNTVPTNTDFVTYYSDITSDKTWTFDDITNLYIYATNYVNGTADGNNLLVDSLWVKVTTSTSDTNPPTSVINNLSDYYNAVNFPATILGTSADDTSVASVSLTIKRNSDNKYWNNVLDEWQNDWVPNTADGTTSWSWDTSCLEDNLTDGVQYTIVSSATDTRSNTESVVTPDDDSQEVFTYDTITPTVDAGTDKTTNAQFSQNATVTGAVTYSWTKISGTGTITFGSASSEDTTIYTNTGGTYQIKLTATDLAGNSASDTMILIWDTTAPTGSVKINGDVNVTNSQIITLTHTASTDVEKMLISNSDDFSTATTPSWENYATSKLWVLSSGNDTKTVYVKFMDQAGNISSVYSDSIYYNGSATNIETNNVVTGTNSITEGNIAITVNANGSTTLTTAQYSQNPKVQNSFSAFGGYFDISVADNSQVIFPVYIKIYYTQTDLNNAGITSESQILGLYYYDSDSNTWKLYSDTGVNTTNVNGYAGYVWANADHFTPMSMGADTTAPNKPSNFKSVYGDGEVKLSWDKVDDAKGYNIRYRGATNDDSKSDYVVVYLDGTTKTETTVTGLTNDHRYEFGVQSVDKAGNKSEWAVVEDMPQKSAVMKEEAKTTSQSFFATKAYAAAPSSTEEKKISGEPEIVTEGAIDSGNVKAEENEDATKSTRAAVTMGIIIIAIGAALGGYYGYQWWLGKNEEEKPTPPKKDYNGKDKEKSKGKQSRRW